MNLSIQRQGLGESEIHTGARNLIRAAFLMLALQALVLAFGAQTAAAVQKMPFLGSLGSFQNVQGLAVDQANGDLYVLDVGAGTISRFDSTGNPAPFSASAPYVSGNVLTGTSGGPMFFAQGKSESQIAVAPAGAAGGTAGDIYVTGSFGTLYIFAATGEFLGTLDGSGNGNPSTGGTGGELCGVATGPDGALYLGYYSGSGHIDKYVPSTNPPANTSFDSTITGTGGPCNVAASSSEVYSSAWFAGPLTAFPLTSFPGGGGEAVASPGRVVSRGVVPAKSSTAIVDPTTDDVIVNEESVVAQFDDAGTFLAESAAGHLSESHGIAVDASGTASDGRVYAGNGTTVQVFGPPAISPPEITHLAAQEVGREGATLEATIAAIEAITYHFEYGPTAAYGSSTPEQNFQASAGGRPVAARINGLAPGTTYHWRLVITYEAGPLASPDQSFTTVGAGGGQEGCPNGVFRTGDSAGLPDCRAYEMVSPVDKNNGDIITRVNVTGRTTNLDQSSLSGDEMTYSAYRAFAQSPGAPYTVQYLAQRDPSQGWLTTPLSPARLSSSPLTNELENEYRVFSPSLDESWLLHETEPVLGGCAPAGYPDLYRRSAAGAFVPLSCATPSVIPNKFNPELQGQTADGTKALLTTKAVLAVSGGVAPSTAGNEQVYLSLPGGSLRLVSVLPNGQASEEEASAGANNLQEINVNNRNRYSSLVHAISEDGARVYWSTGLTGSGPLYLRQNPAGEPSSGGGCGEPGKACTISVSGGEPAYFQAANPNGSEALYTKRTGIAATGPEGDLFRFDAASGTSTLVASDVVGNIAGASADLSRIYFVSKAATPQAEAEGAIAGRFNLYFLNHGSLTFVAIFTDVDLLDTQNSGYGSPVDPIPVFRNARVTPDGAGLVFMSESKALSQSAAGYDNTDAVSGEPDTEVYLYTAGGSPSLRCLSCNPTGVTPHGRLVQGTTWAAATVPPFETQQYQPRYLLDSGQRVYFDSYDDLLPADTNGRADVYQWEEDGTGSCESSSAGYVPKSNGCLSLVSTGRSVKDSTFVDASPSGSDVFIRTAQSLLPQDPGLVDIYDAREDGGFPPPAGSQSACEGEACQGPLSPPNDPTPASAGFRGAGNVRETPKARCAKGKAHRKGRCVSKKKPKAKKSAHNAKEHRANKDRRAGR